MLRSAWAGALCVSVSVWGCSGDDLVCGSGTTERDGSCVASANGGGGGNTLDCGAGTIDANGSCVPDLAVVCAAGTFEDNGECVPDVTCGSGTNPFMGECVPFDPADETAPVTTASPPGGSFAILPALVALSANEPATLYYTTDGSEPTTASASANNQVVLSGLADGVEIRFFAVDVAGNAEAPQSATYVSDQVPPGAPTGLVAAYNAGNEEVDASWMAPTDPDLAGFVVLTKASDPPSVSLLPGALPAVGTTLMDGSFVEQVGMDASVSIAGSPGTSYVQVLAFDEALNFSEPVVAAVVVPAPPVSGNASLSIDISGAEPVLSVTNNPSYPLTGTAALSGGDLTLSLTLTNETGRILTNPKLVVENLNQGTLVNGETTLDGQETVYFGPLSTQVGGESTGDIVISAVTGGANPITLDVTLRTDPMLALNQRRSSDGAQLVDAGTLLLRAETGCGLVFNNGCGKSAAFSSDGRFLYIGHQGMPVIQRYDMVSGEFVDFQSFAETGASLELTGSVEGLVAVGGVLYAAVSNACPGGGRELSLSTLLLVRLNAATFREDARLVLEQDSRHAHVAVSPDGALAAISNSLNDTVTLVELTTLTVVDTDPVTEGVQSLSGIINEPRRVGFNGNGSVLYVTSRNSNNPPLLTRVDLSDYSAQSVTLPTASSQGRGAAIVSDTEGNVWLGYTRNQGNGGPTFRLAAADETPTEVSNSPNTGADAVLLHPDGSTVFVAGGNDVVAFDPAGTEQTSVSVGSNIGGHWGAISPQ